MTVGLIATITTDYIEEMVKVCRDHLQRQLILESGATQCEMFIFGNTIKLVEQWKTEEDYELHKLTPNLELFKTLIKGLVQIDYFPMVENFKYNLLL
jgi:hypothetical protein